MMPLGFSTNCFYYWKLTLAEKIEFLLSLDTTACEIGINKPYPDPQSLIKANEFSYLSVHAHKLDSSETIKEYIEYMQSLVKVISISSIVLHPDQISDFTPFIESGLPFAIENMDREKKSGKTFLEVKELLNNPLKLIIDTQHTFEEDPSMNLMDQLINLGKKRISHFHVSGKSEKWNHSLVYCAQNKELISQKILLIDKPIILEGVVMDEESARKELSFVRSIISK